MSTESYFYIKLPFYIARGSQPSSVEIKIDDELVGTIEVTATDRANMNVLTYPLIKTAETFTLSLKSGVIDTDEEGNLMDHCICLDDIWLSLDGTDFRSIQLNGNTVAFSKVPNEEIFGFNPGIGACLFSDSTTVFTIPVPTESNFEQTYINKSSNDVANFDDDPKLQRLYGDGWVEYKARALKAKELLAARGY